jgi:hypothetical protein
VARPEYPPRPSPHLRHPQHPYREHLHLPCPEFPPQPSPHPRHLQYPPYPYREHLHLLRPGYEPPRHSVQPHR